MPKYVDGQGPVAQGGIFVAYHLHDPRRCTNTWQGVYRCQLVTGHGGKHMCPLNGNMNASTIEWINLNVEWSPVKYKVIRLAVGQDPYEVL